MTLPVYPNAISLSDVNTELGLSATAAISLNDPAVRLLAEKFTGAISLADLHGKTKKTYAQFTTSNSATISGSGTIVTGTASYGKARADIFKTTGKWYWEMKITADAPGDGTNVGLGLATIDWDMAAYGSLGSAGDLYSMGWSGTSMLYNGSAVTPNSGSLVAHVINDVCGFALDNTAQTLDVYLNGVFKAQFPCDTTATGGTPIAALYYIDGSVTANFGATAMAYAPPSGFNRGFYA